MNRRDFLNRHALAASAWTVTAVGGLSVLNPQAQAQGQGDFIEGRDFRRLGNPAPVPGHGKIDVVEFFWYGCPHCHALEPALDVWSAKLPAMLPQYYAARGWNADGTLKPETRAKLGL